MPVGILLCEGEVQSPDARLLLALATTGTTVVPSGSKYGMGTRVLARRQATPGTVTAAVRDRDLERPFAPPTASPLPWTVEGGRVWIGWYWERVEIENYLIDPEVVRRALGLDAPGPTAYRQALEEAAATLAVYTAARTALTQSRARLLHIGNSWGPERGRLHHPLPDARNATQCRSSIRDIVRSYGQSHRITAGAVLTRFSLLLPECREGGRLQHYLTYFSGKDLLCALESRLAAFGLGSPYQFRERVLRGIERATDPWAWLPEWAALRSQLASIDTNDGPQPGS